MSQPMCDPETGYPHYLWDRFIHPDETTAMYSSAQVTAKTPLALETGTAFWVPNGGGESSYTRVSRSDKPTGLTPADQSEGAHRTASVTWVLGLSSPRPGDSAVNPFASTGALVECWFRDVTNPYVYPWYSVLLTSAEDCRESWAYSRCVGLPVTKIGIRIDMASSSQSIDASHPLRIVPVWVEDFTDASERALLPWHPDALDTLDGVSLTSSTGSFEAIDVSSLGLTQQFGRRLGLICYWPFVMPDHWYLSGDDHRFACYVRYYGHELAIPSP